ncbi:MULTISPECIES: MurR/RpiR family transcriptional regulator [Streptomyces]|uniref:Sugar isomerase n=1 Tax=Streptomyces viridochromogenes TaxID=1938 RepID=A0A0J7YXG3_STRVR|nr:MurR/RpiR family transcriptional regulator [Streptomyces viridochromogenes]KMS68234.1 sugar isomerase [Streptomyces viridochromogenes]KOG08878.1 sugar isomerase [Streptomyces viridochromogenes]KOG09655.1 sugar isomerase [Streptomyces viridochromogenes]
MPPTDVTTLIRTELPRLAGSLRKVGELILEDPAAVTHCSAAELGRRTGTSQATVTRFCRAIGLDSYQHLLIELAQERGRGEVSDWGSAEIGPDISPDDSLERVVQVVGSADLRAIQQTIERIDLDALERAAQALARARRIDVYGVGGSGAVAQETETRLFRIGCQVRGWTEVHGAATSAALLTPADVAIGISHSGATRETLEPFEMAKERGATTVAITTDPRSPLAKAADIRLISATSETSFRTGSIGGRHSVLMIVDCLYVRVGQVSYQRASASLALTDHITPRHAVKNRRAR